MAIRFFPATAIGRWITPVHGDIVATSQTLTVARVYMAQFTLPRSAVIDGISYIVGAASAGNVRVAVLGPIAPGTDTAEAAAVLVESASVAQGTINLPQLVPLAATFAPAGVYYAAFQGDNATGTYMRAGNQLQAAGVTQTYDRGGGYGAFTAPTPVTADTGSAIPGLRIRVS